MSVPKHDNENGLSISEWIERQSIMDLFEATEDYLIEECEGDGLWLLDEIRAMHEREKP